MSNSKDDFEVFNLLEFLKVSTGDFSHLPFAKVSQIQRDSSILEAMGIQRKPRVSLLEVMEFQSGSKAPEKTTQAKLPPPLPTQSLRADLASHKRKRDQRSQEVVEGEKGPFPKEAELQKGAKQDRVVQTLADKRGDT